ENFNGTLSIPITVNDGLDDSEPYLLSVDVTAINDIPEITAAVSLSTPEETPLLILIENITVVDPDNDFPGDFTLSVSEGDNYTVSNNEIIPVENFNGTLSVPIIVNDGLDYSEPYLLSVDVTAINDIPEIISTESSFSTNQETSLLISIEDFTVEDPDNDFPGDFILTVMPGNNYTITGNQVLPAKDFSGLLSVFVTVNDGIDESSPYKIEVDVMAILSVKEASSQFLIYPNPAESHITLNNIGQERYNQLLIYDAMGTLIIQKNNLKEDNLTINISSIPEGMYILILKKDEHSVTRKFIKI
ncbi:T9SS type A sorting domain-containing protein, partial [Fulvivirga sp.]